MVVTSIQQFLRHAEGKQDVRHGVQQPVAAISY